MEKALLYATNTLKEEALTAATTSTTAAAVGDSNVVSKAERVNTNAPPTPVRAAEESRPLPPLKKGMCMQSVLFI